MERAFLCQANSRKILKNYQTHGLRLPEKSDMYNHSFKKYGSIYVLASIK
jgi:hypothetical protein